MKKQQLNVSFHEDYRDFIKLGFREQFKDQLLADSFEGLIEDNFYEW